ncbi:unnamed protein product [Caenorhabditis brenneri]
MNGAFKCRNFAQHLATGRFSECNIGYAPWDSRFFKTLKLREELNQVCPYIEFRNKQKRKIRAFFNIKRKFWSLCYQTEGSICLESCDGLFGPPVGIQDVLNEVDGYLEDGALSFEYGFQIDAILGYHDIWMFSLKSQPFNSEEESNTIIIKYRLSGGVYHSPKPLLVFHSLLFGHETKEILSEDKVDECFFIVFKLPMGFDYRTTVSTAIIGLSWPKLDE